MTQMVSWHVPGQLVVCVRAPSDPKYYADEIYPEVNQVLTIRTVEVGIDDICFRFQEILNRPHDYGKHILLECRFKARNFRPVKPTSIESLKAILVSKDATGRRELVDP